MEEGNWIRKRRSGISMQETVISILLVLFYERCSCSKHNLGELQLHKNERNELNY